ncbi:MAG: hypothetical protein ACTH30_10585 [Leucobacter sp.]
MALPRNLDALPAQIKEPQLPSTEIVEKPKRKGTPRARVTAADAHYLAFAAMFPGADSEAFSMLAYREESRFGPGGELPTIKGAEKRLRKLVSLGALEKHRNPTSGRTQFGASKAGIGYARDFGYPLVAPGTLNGISVERLNHYRLIAQVAAQLISPVDYFEESLGISGLTIDDLITEQAMRDSYSPVREQLKTLKSKEGLSADFGKWRQKTITELLPDYRAGHKPWSGFNDENHAIFTVGHPQREGASLKSVHQPDLAVLNPYRNDSRSGNLLIEVELSKKNATEYDRILQTLRLELNNPYVYSRAVYFTVGTQVENLLRKIDSEGGYRLFEKGLLVVEPITHRDGTAVALNRRVVIGGN